MWELSDVLKLIREIQPKVRTFDYHIALGGGVLNKGYSEKDLDLYFIPFSELRPLPLTLRNYLSSLWGTEYNLGGPEVQPQDVHVAYPDEPTWVNGRYTYRPKGLRIDVFIA